MSSSPSLSSESTPSLSSESSSPQKSPSITTPPPQQKSPSLDAIGQQERTTPPTTTPNFTQSEVLPLPSNDLRLVASLGENVEEKSEGEENEKLSKSTTGCSAPQVGGGARIPPSVSLPPRSPVVPRSDRSSGFGGLLLRSPSLRSYSRIGGSPSPSPQFTPPSEDLDLPDDENLGVVSNPLPLHSQSPVVTRFANAIAVPQMVSVDVKTKRRMRKLLRALEEMEDRLVHDYDQLPGLREMFEKELQEFAQSYFNYLCTSSDKLIWKSIRPLKSGLRYDRLIPCSPDAGKAVLSRSCILRLNGGKHSTLGTVAPECTLEIRPHLSFLDMAVRQANFLAEKYGEQIDLAFLNSFLTHEETLKLLTDYDDHEHVDISVFTQSRFPMLYKDSHTLVPENFIGCSKQWYPPGTGDVLPTLLSCGVLKEWIRQGKDIIFISNVDNLGATFEPHIAKYMLDNGVDFLAEVTDYTKNDSKRSFITQYLGTPKVISGKKIPAEHREDFLKQKHAVYTGNCWINLHALLKVIEGGHLRSLDVLTTVGSFQGKDVIQFERKLASAISLFSNSAIMHVPRSRFVPVRTVNDLFLVQSNLYSVNKKEGTVSLNPKRPYGGLPQVRLGEKMSNVAAYKSRFEGIPNILELDRLTLGGEVRFGKNVTLSGSVIIIAKEGGEITIPSGTVLENKIVNGSLNLVNH